MKEQKSKHEQIRDLIGQMFVLQKFWEELKLIDTTSIEIRLTRNGCCTFQSNPTAEKFTKAIIKEALDNFSKTKTLESLFTGKDIIIALLIQKVVQETVEINERLVKLGAPPFDAISV